MKEEPIPEIAGRWLRSPDSADRIIAMSELRKLPAEPDETLCHVACDRSLRSAHVRAPNYA